MKEKKSKYFSKKVSIDGITFDSQKEANRYVELKTLEKCGKIKNLELQVPYLLIPTQYKEITTFTPKTHKEIKKRKIAEYPVKYIADFVYEQDGNLIVEDVKGYKKSGAYSVFVIKRKLMRYIYGVEVKEF